MAAKNRELPKEIKEIITALWQTTTRSIYESALKQWKCYALLQNENPYITSTESVRKFLHGMYNDGCLCSNLCAARSALASVVTNKGFANLSDHPLRVRHLNGIFNRYPPLPRYMFIWDTNLVLTYYNKIGHNKELEFKYLLKKIVMLLMILGARRKHALSTIYVYNIVSKMIKLFCYLI